MLSSTLVPVYHSVGRL